MVGALRVKRLGATKRDEVFVGNANHERFFAGQRKHAEASRTSSMRIVFDCAFYASRIAVN